MPFDGNRTKLAPTLKNLAKLLRDRNSWPEDFEFDFWNCEACGMGLADKYWGWEIQPYPNTLVISQKFGMNHEAAKAIFLSNPKYTEPTAETLACTIEAYLATQTLPR